MNEVINVHVGQAGNQIGETCWELFNLEHNINNEGLVCNGENNQDNHIRTFYSESQSHKFTPRALFVDKDAINNTFSFVRQLYINGSQPARTFEVGHESKIMEQVVESVRKQAEDCQSLQGFMIYRSISGGTGSGLGSAILEYLSDQFGDKSKIEIAVRDLLDDGEQAIDNTVLAAHSMLQHSDCSFMINNAYLRDICASINTQPSFYNINTIISQMVSSLTLSMRIDGYMFTSLSNIIELLVPSPRLIFPSLSISPFTPFQSPQQITDLVLEQANILNSTQNTAKLVSAYFMYRGDFIPKEIGQKLCLKIKQTVRFTEQCSIKFGINYQNAANVSKSVIMAEKSLLLAYNSTDFKFWNKIIDKYEGKQNWNDNETEALTDLKELEKDYTEMENDVEPANQDDMNDF
ncbi:Alpha-tubulin [Hexamita inflata]|uniref:Tubulin alpha chain n=1 Tax=Hexamita inflata TaxID=28002 RepID=A0AA86R831_9EUKA|nr:Alpha-tubulin [Hexamita inflata]